MRKILLVAGMLVSCGQAFAALPTAEFLQAGGSTPATAAKLATCETWVTHTADGSQGGVMLRAGPACEQLVVNTTGTQLDVFIPGQPAPFLLTNGTALYFRTIAGVWVWHY